MARNPLPGWVDDLVADLDSRFDPGAVARGRGYQAERRVTQVVASREGQTLLATVRGSGRSVYQSLINAQPSGRALVCETRCSCPLGGDCKHVVAALLEAHDRRAGGSPGSSAWEALFEGLTLPPRTTAAPSPHELEVGLQLSWPGSGPLPLPGDRVELRPVRRGASGRWVKSELTWSSVAYARGVSDPARAAFAALSRVAAAHAQRSYYAYGADKVHLGDLGSGVAHLLSDAVRAGVALLAPGETRVLVDAATVRPRLDLTRSASGGVQVAAVWAWDDGEAAPEEVSVQGDPPAALVTRRGDALHVAALAPVDASVWPLVRVGRIDIPAEDAERFLSTYGLLLRRRADVTSSDGSCPPPPEVAPRLAVEARYDQGHRLVLTWSFAYGEGVLLPLSEASAAPPPRAERSAPPWRRPAAPPPRVSPAPLAPGRAAAEALRDRPTEARLIGEAVALLEPHVPGVIWPRGPRGVPQPYSPSGLVGMQTAVFTAHVLPALRAHPEIDVTVVGEPADYRYVEEAPVVRLGIGGEHEAVAGGAAGPPGGAGPPPGEGGGTDWFDLDVRIELDGEEVPFRPLFAALAADEPHLLLGSGAWFDLDRPELGRLRTLIEEARALSDRDGPLRISRWQAGLWDELTEIGVVAQQSETWRRAVGGLLDADLVERAEPPPGLRATLRPYQVEGFRWLSYLWEHRLGGILADDMGLGKTVQALAAILRAREQAAAQGRDEAPVLVVAPTSVLSTWQAEAARFAPDLRVVALTETAARRRSSLAQAREQADVIVTSYALVRIEAEDYRAASWAAVLLDEAQFLKNPRGKTHQVVRALPAPVKIAMTGTPLENSLMDLWALLSVTAPGLFPQAEVFTELYRRPIESGADPQALARLQRRLRPLMLRRTKELVAPELPPKQEQVLRITLTAAHQRLYDRQLQRERQRVLGLLADFDRNRVAIFRSLTALRQLALAPALVDPEGPGAKIPATKIEAFAQQIAEVAAEGHRALVFSQFTGFLGLVRERLERDGIDYAYLDGRTRDRAERIESWRRGDQPVFLISLKAGGFGLTLTEADYVYVLDPWWNPAAEAQAVDRTHRLGQDKTVMVYRLIAQDTIEEKVLALQQRKRDLFSRVIDDGGAIDGMLTADDIRGLLEP